MLRLQKDLKLVSILIAPIMFFSSQACLALNTATLDVTAQVTSACNFNQTSYSMPFGAYDSTDQTTPVLQQVQLQFTCTSNVNTATIAMDAGQNSGGGEVTPVV